jgi:hypothetical protein
MNLFLSPDGKAVTYRDFAYQRDKDGGRGIASLCLIFIIMLINELLSPPW